MDTILNLELVPDTAGGVNVKYNPIDNPKSAYDAQLRKHARLALVEAADAQVQRVREERARVIPGGIASLLGGDVDDTRRDFGA